MKKPTFLKSIYSGLIIDLILLFLCLFAGYGIYLILAVMLYFIPIFVGAMGVRDAVGWTQEKCGADGFISSLSRLLCGSSLAFLLVATGVVIWGGPAPDSNIFEILAFLYLFVLLLRFTGAGLANVFASIPCLIMGRGLDRLNAVAALLCSGAGLHITLSWLQPQAGENYQSLFIFALINFGYGLVYGGGLQWLARELATPDEGSS